MKCGELDYALTRIRARTSQRMTQDDWANVHRLRGYDAAIAALRAGNASHWIAGLDLPPNAVLLEARLRAAWALHINQLCSWLTPPWQACVGWCAKLTELDANAAAPGTADPLEHWAAGLRSRLPQWPAEDIATYPALTQMLRAHRQRFSALPAGNAWPERAILEVRLLTLLRRNALEPVMVLAWIALLALEWERLRGELVRRAALELERCP